ncbi:MAG: exopolysaccharide biosynthesis predicted pyruvyl transferase EpsI [Cyclobacteriaceae bacterium]|jgi:exopolysaccharide biosynthesis predicted pyruvyltransferase EpsI
MKNRILSSIYFQSLKTALKIFFTFGKKVYILGTPYHANMGDQAQLYCTMRWLKENYPERKIVRISTQVASPAMLPYSKIFFKTLFSSLITLILRFKITRDDLLIGHSGYFITDHHPGLALFLRIIYYFPKNKFVIFPQTVNLYSPEIADRVSEVFKTSKDLTLICRDEISFQNAKVLFPKTKLLLYPDIVTSLIGSRHYDHSREGILFCLRNDNEAYYRREEINELISKFGNIKSEITDTSIKMSIYEMDKKREVTLLNMFDYFSKFKIVVTDRYHGTIFSLITCTPVIVLSSADHKLSSGVKWFPESFSNYVKYAKDLNEAENLINSTFKDESVTYEMKPYFLNTYYSKLKEELNSKN